MGTGNGREPKSRERKGTGNRNSGNRFRKEPGTGSVPSVPSKTDINLLLQKRILIFMPLSGEAHAPYLLSVKSHMGSMETF